MSAIYLHIPFCKQLCNYCNFYISINKTLLPNIVDAICKETLLRPNYLTDTVHSIYFGGGTPSLCSVEQIEKILMQLHTVYNISNHAEITLETNPDDITMDALAAWKQIGVNRLSIGVQSFDDIALRWMGRAHYAQQSLEAIVHAQSIGFENITIDLIYGSPNLSNEQWEKNIATAVALNIPHISCYALTVEPKTILHKKIIEKKEANISEEKQAMHFAILQEKLTQAGYEQYEISNFAKPNFRSKHNSSYWEGKYYLGLGPSAHSFNGTSRQWNIANNMLYMQAVNKGTLCFEGEELTTTQRVNEYIMLALRTIKGIDLQQIEKEFGIEVQKKIEITAKKYIARGSLVHNATHLYLSKEALFFADGIASDLFLDTNDFPN